LGSSHGQDASYVEAPRLSDCKGTADLNNAIEALSQRFDARLVELGKAIPSQYNSHIESVKAEFALQLESFKASVSADSEPSHDRPSEPLVEVKPRQFLTRLSRRGIDFMDSWRPLKVEFTADQIKAMYAGFGSDDPDFDRSKCVVRSNDPARRRPVGTVMAAHGLGMNLIQFANNIIWAAHNNHFITFIRTTEHDKTNGGLHRHGFQNWFEKAFTFSQNKDSVCDIYTSICLEQKDRCYDGYWNNTSPNPKNILWYAFSF
jgi:hypothetical protein